MPTSTSTPVSFAVEIQPRTGARYTRNWRRFADIAVARNYATSKQTSAHRTMAMTAWPPHGVRIVETNDPPNVDPIDFNLYWDDKARRETGTT